VVAKPDFEEAKPYIFSLDRIHKLHTTDETFEMPKDWSAEDFFKDSFGIIVDSDVEARRIVLKVSAGQANYIRDLKLHESQEEIECNEEYSIFRYRLRPQYDFIQELLWNGGDVEVLEPIELRKEITNIIKGMWNKYN
jgi:predicted DNA-binding transcriptional regulator YafY